MRFDAFLMVFGLEMGGFAGFGLSFGRTLRAS